MAALVLFLAPSRGRAQGIDMAFEDCPGAPAAIDQWIDACDSNTGDAMRIVVSFVWPDFLGVTNLTSLSAEIRVSTPILGYPLPAWWRLDSCRTAAIVDVGVPDPTVCSDPWGGAVSTYRSFAVVPPGDDGHHPTSGYLRINVEIAALEAASIQPGVKYQAFTLRIGRARTVGPGACAGCCGGACIWLDHVELDTESQVIRMTGGSNSLSWQAGYAGVGHSCFGDRCAVPVRRGTWGALKALYR